MPIDHPYNRNRDRHYWVAKKADTERQVNAGYTVLKEGEAYKGPWLTSFSYQQKAERATLDRP